jgi:hypothetical protein
MARRSQEDGKKFTRNSREVHEKFTRSSRESPEGLEEFSPVVFNDVKKQEMRPFKKQSHALQEC